MKTLVYVTCADEEEAGKLAKVLLEKRLIACANVFPSHTAWYRWDDKIESGQETAMILKTREDLFEELRECITEHHSYDTPCIISIPITQGHNPFMAWIERETDELLRK